MTMTGREFSFKATFERSIFEGSGKTDAIVSSAKHNFAGRECSLDVYPNGHQERLHVACYVACESKYVTEARVKIELVNSKGDAFSREFKERYQDEEIGYQEYILKTALLDSEKGFIVNNKIEFTVYITLYNTFLDVQPPPYVSISNELSKLLFDETLSDAKIKVDNEVIPIHKIVLYSHSEVFRAMFTSNMLETTTNIIEITDFDAHIVQEFLKFVYTGACPVEAMEIHCEELLAVASKYQVEGLVITCINHLITNLSLKTVQNSLCIADKYGAIDLKQACLTFIAANAKSVVAMDGFLSGFCPDLWQEVMKAIIGVDMTQSIGLPIHIINNTH